MSGSYCPLSQGTIKDPFWLWNCKEECEEGAKFGSTVTQMMCTTVQILIM